MSPRIRYKCVFLCNGLNLIWTWSLLTLNSKISHTLFLLTYRSYSTLNSTYSCIGKTNSLSKLIITKANFFFWLEEADEKIYLVRVVLAAVAIVNVYWTYTMWHFSKNFIDTTLFLLLCYSHNNSLKVIFFFFSR